MRRPVLFFTYPFLLIWCLCVGFLGIPSAFALDAHLTKPSIEAADVAPPVRELRQGPTLTVKSVGYGASFDLSNGRRVRLVNIRVPKPNTPPFTASAEPMGDKAKAFVQSFVRNHTLTLYFDHNDTDRYGRWLAHVVRDDGKWLQQELLENGLARIYTFPDNRWGIEQLLSFERKARRKGRGIWGKPYYQIRTPDTIQAHIGSFQIVEGRVLSQSRGKGTVYLNFGPDWKTDFTLRIPKKHRKTFSSQTHEGKKGHRNHLRTDEIQNYVGQRIRARGWVKQRNGPMIDLTHPEQIEQIN